jgi:hypothetical protein
MRMNPREKRMSAYLLSVARALLRLGPAEMASAPGISGAACPAVLERRNRRRSRPTVQLPDTNFFHFMHFFLACTRRPCILRKVHVLTEMSGALHFRRTREKN